MASKIKFWMKPWDTQAWATSKTRRRLSLGAIGLYHELTDHQWIEGSIPDDVDEICVIVGKPKSAVEPLWREIKSLFPKCGRHVRRSKTLDVRRRFAREKHDVDASKGLKGAKVRAANALESTSRQARLKQQETRNKKQETNPLSPPPPVGSAADDLDSIWSRIVETYPHPSGQSQARISYLARLGELDDPVVLAKQILAAAEIFREVHQLDPSGHAARPLPSLANFVDGGYLEDKSKVLERLRKKAAAKDGPTTLADQGESVFDIVDRELEAEKK